MSGLRYLYVPQWAGKGKGEMTFKLGKKARKSGTHTESRQTKRGSGDAEDTGGKSIADVLLDVGKIVVGIAAIVVEIVVKFVN